MEITNRIVYLLRKHISPGLDAAEQAELRAWADRHPAFRKLLDEVADETQLKSALKAFDTAYEGDEAGSVSRMEARIAKAVTGETPTKKLRFRQWVPYAAAVLIAAIVATWVFFGEEINQKSTIVNLQAEDIAPGGNRATLTLADGRTVDLSEEQSGIVVGDGIKYADGTEILDIKQQTTDTEKESLGSSVSRLLSLTTPKGGTYQITLPDGTEVWLNAASTLKYPSRFSKEERVVELSGEAYFDVRQQTIGNRQQAFRVVSKGQTIEVLGTQFNISAYEDEDPITTTLVDGSVEVVNRKSKVVSRLSPGEQSTTREAATKVQAVDVQTYTAWREGRFSFENKSFDQVFRELARWYDIDIRYEGPVPEVEFYGGAFRNKNLDVVLRLLESAKLSYRMDGRILVINTKEGGYK